MHISAQKVALAVFAAVFVGGVSWSFGRRFSLGVGWGASVACSITVFVLWLIV